MADKALLQHTAQRMLNEYPKYRDTEANVQIVVNVCVETNAQFPSDVRRVIENLMRQGRLAVSTVYSDSFARLAKVAPEYFPLESNEHLVLQALGNQDATIQNVVAAVKSVEDSLSLNAYGQQQEYAHQQKAIADRQNEEQFAKDDAEADEIIAELLQPFLDGDGNLKRYRDGSQIPYAKYANRKAELEAMDIVQLRAEVAPIREAQRVKALSPADLRKEIGAPTTTQKLQELYQGRYAVMDKRGYEVPASATPQNGLTPTFIPWGLKLVQHLDPETIKSLIRRYGAEQFERACREGAR